MITLPPDSPRVPGTTRRNALRWVFGITFAGILRAAGHFWDTKPASSWTADEIQELIGKSPWAKQVTAQYRGAMEDLQPGAPPVSFEHGGVGTGECGLVACSDVMPGKAAVTWESALPIREAVRSAIPPEFNGHYVIGIRGLEGAYTADRLKAASELSAKGKPPVQAGMVGLRGRTYLFGFSRELLPLDVNDKDVRFTVHTGARLTETLVSATFNPKDMIYRGALAL